MNINIMIICKCDVLRYRIFIPDLTLILLVPVSLDYNTLQRVRKV